MTASTLEHLYGLLSRIGSDYTKMGDRSEWKPFFIRHEICIRGTEDLEKTHLFPAERRLKSGFDILRAAAFVEYMDQKKQLPYHLTKEQARKFLGLSTDDFHTMYCASVMSFRMLKKPSDSQLHECRKRILSALHLKEPRI